MGSAVLTAVEMRAAEEAAFAAGLTAEGLMDEAAAGLARRVAKFFPAPGLCVVFAGKGNNAGDAFAAAELLLARDWAIEWRLAFSEEELGELARKKLTSLRAALAERATARRRERLGATAPLVVLDGLLGVGATPPLREPVRTACRELNALRREQAAYVFAIDLPSGLESDRGEADPDCVVADVTVAIGLAKRGLLADGALDLVGRIEVVTLAGVSAPTADRDSVATAGSLRHLLGRRAFGAYKNQFGRVGVVAGSKGFTGAALLCSLGALRGGAGLVQLFVLEELYDLIAASAAPELMVKPIASYAHLADEPIDIWAVGPGLGRAHAPEILQLIAQIDKPMVLDADALNILATDMTLLERSKSPRLLTPHPGEMQRLFPRDHVSRAEQAQQFCATYPVTLLLKGSRTIVAEKSRPLSYNTTGNPGMATGGMGDVLTGVCAALIGQKLSTFAAAQVGAWVCGRAAEIAVFGGDASEQSLLPSDVLANLGRAFKELHSSPDA
ncbi:MAG: NAD(P)H-hydrate dehydratase [Chthoniobacterales bacterium]